MKEMQQIMSLIMTIEITASMDVFSPSLLLPLASCLPTPASALLGIMETAAVSSIRQLLLSCTERVLHFSAGHPGRPISVIPVWAGQLTKQLDF